MLKRAPRGLAKGIVTAAPKPYKARPYTVIYRSPPRSPTMYGEAKAVMVKLKTIKKREA
jgi:hypothetical protein